MGSKDMNCDGCGYYYCNCQVVVRSKILQDLHVENARLRAELEALKPKPVVTEHYYVFVGYSSLIVVAEERAELKLIKHDGKLVSTKVKNDKGEWL